VRYTQQNKNFDYENNSHFLNNFDHPDGQEIEKEANQDDNTLTFLNNFQNQNEENLLQQNQHQNVNCSSLPVRVQCHLCGSKLFQHNLVAHNRIHTGERPFRCGFCFRPFRLIFYLNLNNY
jgi:hypothetical protein